MIRELVGLVVRKPQKQQFMLRIYALIGLVGTALVMLGVGVSAGPLFIVLALAFALALVEWLAHYRHAHNGLASKVFDTSSNGIMITDSHNIVLTVNPAFTAITGYTAEDMIGKNPRLLSSGRQDQAFYEKLWQSIKTDGMWQGEIWNRNKDGAVFVEWLTINAVKNIKGETTHHIAIFSDITERKEQTDRLEYLATHDPLTGLANRALFSELLNKALSEARRSKSSVAILFLDIDKFKQINDTFGHYIGDLLLQHVANSLLKLLRAGDIVARQGGDEFIMALPNLSSPQAAILLAEKILRTLEEPCTLNGQALKVTTSIGIALFPEDGTEIGQLMQSADIALYRAKQAGRNNFQLFKPSSLEPRQ